MEQRAAMVKPGGAIDWGCAEALAFGSLLLEGTPVRLTGQDSGRGTFSHRHAVLHDFETDARWVPLDHIRASQARFTILDSMLSENAVLGFEYGFSSADPRNLVIWEAQFGDFANGAQVDHRPVHRQRRSRSGSGMSGLVMLLPHGYEGQGPEHSSARLERYLQLCADDNMQVCNLTTPAQYFHALRRQMHRTFRKPLVDHEPEEPAAAQARGLDARRHHGRKIPDRHRRRRASRRRRSRRDARSGARHARPALQRQGLLRALLAGRRDRAIDSVAIVRVEQLYPFPSREIGEILAGYPNARQVLWVQEEPWNMGAWHFVYHPLRRVLPDDRSLAYVGRPAAASPASGSYKIHQAEEADLVNRAFARTAARARCD